MLGSAWLVGKIKHSMIVACITYGIGVNRSTWDFAETSAPHALRHSNASSNCLHISCCHVWEFLANITGAGWAHLLCVYRDGRHEHGGVRC